MWRGEPVHAWLSWFFLGTLQFGRYGSSLRSFGFKVVVELSCREDVGIAFSSMGVACDGVAAGSVGGSMAVAILNDGCVTTLVDKGRAVSWPIVLQLPVGHVIFYYFYQVCRFSLCIGWCHAPNFKPQY